VIAHWRTANPVWRALEAGLSVVLIIVAIAVLAGCDSQEDRDFKQACQAKGKVGQIEHRGNATIRRCVVPVRE
jgi:hypothetical protein